MSIKISSLLPQRFQDTTINTFLDNTVQKFLTAESTRDVYGWVGEKTNSTDYYVIESDTDRQLNQLVPFIDITHSTERKLMTFKDVLTRLETLGIDLSNFSDWGAVQSYNFAPPIDYDKFTNYNQYYWIAPTVSGYEDLSAQYYCIEKGGTSDWSVENFWVHVDDADDIDLSICSQAIRPIVEYKLFLESELNSHLDNGVPSNAGTAYVQKRTKNNQIPLFNTYRQDGTFSGYVTGIFFYKETASSTYDSALQRYVEKDVNGDFTFSIGLIDANTTELLFYKKNGSLTSLWEKSTIEAPEYFSVEDPGALINKDKLVNYANYYWIGSLAKSTITGNPKKMPEYTTIARAGSSAFSAGNYWVHENQLAANNIDKNTVQQALKPIIEFSTILESSLVEDKTTFDQIPQFYLYDSTGAVEGGFNIATLYDGDITDSQYTISVDDILMLQDLKSRTGYTRYFKVYNKLMSLTSVDDIFTTQNRKFVKSSPTLNDGAWKVPSYMFGNIQNKQTTDFKYADLVSHTISVMNAQDYDSESLVAGSPFGKNTFRKLSNVDLGKAGLIKEYNENWSLFISVINQENVNIYDVINFMRDQYAAFLTSMYNYVIDTIPQKIASGDLESSTSIGSVADDHVYSNGTLKSNSFSVSTQLIDDFYTFYMNQSSLVVDTTTTADDDATIIIKDSTSPIAGLILTLPMLKLANLVEPVIGYDSRIGMSVIVHHDGHHTESYTQSSELMKSIADKFYTRSNGQKTAGFVTDNFIPARPFARQYWYDQTTDRLFMFSVESDTIDNEPAKSVGKYWYLRDDDKLLVCLEKNGELRWFDVESTELSAYFSKNDPWVEVRIDTLVNTVIQTVEHDIYEEILKRNNSVAVETKYPYSDLVQNSSFKQLAYKQFAEYANRFGLDLFKSDYDPDNAFTWNYSTLGKHLGISINDTYAATWYDIYYALFETARPDVEPWILVGQTREAFLATLADLDIQEMTEEMWAYVETKYTGDFLIPVDFATNALIPPYTASNARSLLNAIPDNADERFTFGENAPVELAWTTSIDYAYDIIKVVFKLYPLTFIADNWGYEHVTLSNGYQLDKKRAKKITNKDFYLHGDVNTDTDVNGTVVAGQVKVLDGNTAPIYVELVRPNYFSVTQSGRSVTHGSILYDGAFVVTDLLDVEIEQTYRGMSIGDKFKVEFNESTGAITSAAYIPATYIKLHGLSQPFAQLMKYKSVHFPTTFDYSAYKNWDISFGYGFTTLINTDSVELKIDSGYLAKDEDYSIVLKKTRDVHRFPFTAMYCQLVEKGIYNITQHGIEYPLKAAADWVFKIDGFNTEESTITVKTFDTTSDNVHTFLPLDGAACTQEFTVYYDVTGEKEYTLPVLITGAQNVLNFVLGYGAYLEEQGFKFNDKMNTISDERTGKTNSWRTEVEKMLDQMWRGVKAGDGFVFNPIRKHIFFKNDVGMVSSLTQHDKNSFKLAYAADVSGRRLSGKHLRVFRQDRFTEITSDAPIYSGRITLDEYEHVAVFENTSLTNGTVLFDPILGISVPRVLVDVKKQLYLTSDLSFGGNYLSGDEHRSNVESSVKGIENYYDSSASLSKDVLERARNLFGYNSSFLDGLDINPKSRFEFWKGMIKNKGSNLSVSAFTNSKSFSDISVDEYWMYKVADYGDSVGPWSAEIKVSDAMLLNDYTNLYFLETDETASDDDVISISKIDDDIFYSYDDLNRDTYFASKLVATKTELITEGHTGVIDIVDADSGILVDYAELWCEGKRYVFYAAGWDATKYDKDVYDSDVLYDDSDIYIELLNSTTARIKDVAMFVGKTVVIKGYAQSFDSIGPFEIADYKNNVVVSRDVILWHPAAGIHDPSAMKNINVRDTVDPASYNITLSVSDSLNYVKFKPWGSNEVGRVWLDTRHLDYLPYYDCVLTPEVSKRVSLWGSLAEYADYNLYQWTESDITPAEHMKKFTAGELATQPARKTLFTTERVWSYVPVAWKYGKNPKAKDRAFFDTIDPIQIKEPNSVAGSLIAINTHTFEYNDIDDVNTTFIIYDSEITDAVGEYRITDFDKYYVVGTDDNYFDAGIADTDYFESIVVEVNDSDYSTARNNLGKYKFSTETISDVAYVKLMNVQSGDVQKIVIDDTENLVGARETYYFDKFGVKVKFVCKYDHDSAQFGTTDVRLDQLKQLFTSITFSVREAMWADPMVTVGESSTIGKNFSLNYVAFYTPTKEDLESDTLAPANKYEPVYCNEIVLRSSLIDLHTKAINEQIKKSITWQNSAITLYTYELNDWVSIDERFVKFKYVSDSQFAAKTKLSADEVSNSSVRLYVNGVKVAKSSFDTNSDGTASLTTSATINVGDTVTMIVLIPEISKEKLAVFDNLGTKSDEATNNTLYKYDCDYSAFRSYDSSASTYVTKYYYWVSGGDLIANGGMTLSEIKNRLKKYSSPYAILTYPAGAYGNLPERYKGVSLVNLKYAVDKPDTYKVKLNNNHYLRKFETDLVRKNIHTEWKLIKRSMIESIPEKLWTKFVDSIVGETAAGMTIPAQARVRYDKKHGTTVQYGFGDDQILFDSSDAKTALIYYVEELDKYIEGGIVVDGFDLDTFVSNIDDAAITRKYLNILFNKMKPEYVNSLFFDVIELGLTYNYVFTDLVKTSYVSIVSSKELKAYE